MLSRPNSNPLVSLLFSLLLVVCACGFVTAQTSSFTYQGKLTDGGTPANGSYDLQFTLWDSLSGGAQIGAPQTVNTVAVSNGVFTVSIDFGASAFPGANRFLEINARLSGGSSFTVLSPRQQVTSTMYAVRSLNANSADGLSAACSGCVSDTNINSVAASKVSGTIPVGAVPSGSSNYVQNTTAPQADSNFNISGNGTVGGTMTGNVVNAGTQYNIAGTRVVSIAGTANLFTGVNAGSANTTGATNAFFGANTGKVNTTGGLNSFFGGYAGSSNTSANNNSFFGAFAGGNNTTGADNSFFGKYAGLTNTTGSNNTFFGSDVGAANTTGTGNTFFGASAGFSNTTAGGNSFFGFNSGYGNTTGSSNSFFGHATGGNNTTGCCNAFFGYRAGISNTTGSSNAFFGMNAGLNNTTGFANSFFGTGAGDVNATGGDNSFFGDSAGGANTTGNYNSFFGRYAGPNSATGGSNSFFGWGTGFNNWSGNFNSFFGRDAGQSNSTENNNTFIGALSDGQAGITNATAVGYLAKVTQSNSLVLGSINGVNAATADTNVGIGTTAPADRLHVNGIIRVDVLGAAGATALCRNAANQISACSSSLRYKTALQPFTGGFDIINRLRPISFAWKLGGMRDIGLGAEEVEKVEPLLTFRNDKGEIEGVKYNQLSAVFINAFKEQQAQIKQQQEQIKQQRTELARQEGKLTLQQQELQSLKKLVCRSHRRATVCR